MTTQIHDSTTCTAGVDGQPCEMCHFAREFEKSRSKSPSDASRPENQPAGFLVPEAKNAPQGEYGAGIAISAPDFEQEWESAPSARRRHTEQEDAFFWFMRGVRCGQLGQMLEDNRVFRQMAEQRGLG